VLGVAFVSLAEGIDATTPAGRLQFQASGILSACSRALPARLIPCWRTTSPLFYRVGRRRPHYGVDLPTDPDP